MINLWYKRKTKNLKKIPLFTMYFDLRKYRKSGKKGSCDWMVNEKLANDSFLREEMKKCADYVRENYDMEIFSQF